MDAEVSFRRERAPQTQPVRTRMAAPSASNAEAEPRGHGVGEVRHLAVRDLHRELVAASRGDPIDRERGDRQLLLDGRGLGQRLRDRHDRGRGPLIGGLFFRRGVILCQGGAREPETCPEEQIP